MPGLLVWENGGKVDCELLMFVTVPHHLYIETDVGLNQDTCFLYKDGY